ncbi:MAG: TetR family transcriptional regulator [Ktedonobacterales bacterium]
MSPQPQVERPGLRERKKAKTRAAIQQHALRLFHKQGYEATTVEQIAEAAEISPSTFFRYFPTKEDAVMWDDLDPQIIPAFESQPAELSPIQALRRAMGEVLTRLSTEERTAVWRRAQLILSIPELRMRMLDQFTAANDQAITNILAELVAKRMGHRPDEFAVRCFAGALMGVMLAAIFASANDPQADFIELIDAGLANLEAGMPL